MTLLVLQNKRCSACRLQVPLRRFAADSGKCQSNASKREPQLSERLSEEGWAKLHVYLRQTSPREVKCVEQKKRRDNRMRASNQQSLQESCRSVTDCRKSFPQVGGVQALNCVTTEMRKANSCEVGRAASRYFDSIRFCSMLISSRKSAVCRNEIDRRFCSRTMEEQGIQIKIRIRILSYALSFYCIFIHLYGLEYSSSFVPLRVWLFVLPWQDLKEGF